MKKWLKILFGLLVIASIVSLSVTFYVQAQTPTFEEFGDIRDYFPFGLWIKVFEVNTTLNIAPDEVVKVYNDTTIASAIASINESRRWEWVPEWMKPKLSPYSIEYINRGWVWVKQDSPGEWQKIGNTPKYTNTTPYFLWVPNGKYYSMPGICTDGIPWWWNPPKSEPTSTTTAVMLSLAWISFGLVAFIQHRKK